MPHIEGNWEQVFGNHLIMEQREYHTQGLAQLAAEHIATFTQDQSTAFEKITSAVSNGSGQTFFLHGPGGTGKTYVYNTLCHYLHSQDKIVVMILATDTFLFSYFLFFLFIIITNQNILEHSMIVHASLV